jgi:hypothetical protein
MRRAEPACGTQLMLPRHTFLRCQATTIGMTGWMRFRGCSVGAGRPNLLRTARPGAVIAGRHTQQTRSYFALKLQRG